MEAAFASVGRKSGESSTPAKVSNASTHQSVRTQLSAAFLRPKKEEAGAVADLVAMMNSIFGSAVGVHYGVEDVRQLLTPTRLHVSRPPVVLIVPLVPVQALARGFLVRRRRAAARSLRDKLVDVLVSCLKPAPPTDEEMVVLRRLQDNWADKDGMEAPW